MVTLYTTHCPNCVTLEKMLNSKHIEFNIIEDRDEMIEVGRANNIFSAPILKVDDKVYKFVDALKWAREQ